MVMESYDPVVADVTVDMGKADRVGTGFATVGGRRLAGVAVDVGNPHLACVDPSLTVAELAALDVAAPVQFDPAQFPHGVNVEVLTAPSDGGDALVWYRHRGRRGRRPAAYGCRHRHPGRAHPRRTGECHRDRRHQLPARAVGDPRAR